ncbi:MAG: TonB family protein [Acidobacteriaceae bacterium]|nr:TonB family protein [Acidobacteriaceae bacterium]
MLRLRTLLAITVVLLFAAIVKSADPNGAWHLSDALRMAVAKVDMDDTSVQNARLELAMLEALNKTRVEFRPQFSIWSFSNPLLLATSIGGSFSVNKRTAPSPVNVELARMGLIQAEIGHARNRVNAEVNVTSQFFNLAEAQDLRKHNCDLWGKRIADRQKVQTLVSFNRITKLDVVRFEQDLTALESDCVEARAQTDAAKLALVRLVGRDGMANKVEIATDDLRQIAVGEDLPESEQLLNAALSSNEDFKTISEHLGELSVAPAKHKFHFESLSAGYSYLWNSEKGLPQGVTPYLAGGNVLHLDTAFYISLRHIGDVEATNAYLQARFKNLQHDADDLKLVVRRDIEDNKQRAILSAARLRVAQKRQTLADELEQLTIQRATAGLQSTNDELWASRDAVRAEAASARVELEWQQSAFMVLALCDPQKLEKSSLLARTDHAGPSHVESALLAPPPAVTVPTITPGFVPASLMSEKLLPRPAVWVNSSRGSAPITGAGLPRVTTPPGSIPPTPAPSYIPPQPLSRTLPSFGHTHGIPTYGVTEIDIQVRIDEHGRVTDAQVRTASEHVSGALTAEAIAAARQWTFTPAKLNGKNIPCDHTIAFVLHPTT